MPGVGFSVVEIDFIGIKRSEPLVIQFRTHEAGGWIKDIFIILGPLDEFFIITLFTHFFCHLGYTPVIVRIFQGFGDRFALLVTRNESLGFVIPEAKMILVCTLFRRFEGLLHIVITDPFDVSICNHRDSMITDHAVCFIGRELPYRKNSPLIILPEEGPDEIIGSLLIDDGQQGMQRPVSVPQREYGIIVETVSLMGLHVSAQVLPIDVHI